MVKERNPVGHKSVENLERVPRRVFCLHYDSCLDVAIERGWASFSCLECSTQEEEDRALSASITQGSVFDEQGGGSVCE